MKNSFLLIAFLPVIYLLSSGIAVPENIHQNTEPFDVTFYYLDLNVSDTSVTIDGFAQVVLKSLVPSLSEIELDLAGEISVDSVQANGKITGFSHKSDILTISPSTPVPLNQSLTLTVFYHGLDKTGRYNHGITHSYVGSYHKNVTWTLSEPFASKYWFPCKQVLTDKADSAYVFLSTDRNRKAGSNGILTNEVILPGNRVRYEWKCRYPIAYYLISFSVSDYMDYSFYVKEPSGSDSIFVQNYIYNDSAYFAKNKASIDKTADLIRLYSKIFGTYPFSREKYGHCLAPMGGGMEHQTMTTLVNFGFLLVAHELAHQWFGDQVTCKSWQDIWINEGFASYAEYLSEQYLVSQTEADNWIIRNNRFIRSLPDGSIYVPLADVNDEDRIFDSRLSYKKGASMIHMIRQELGDDELFFDILSTFLMQYQYGNANAEDFRGILEKKTNRDFGWFFDQWFYGQGYPIHQISWSQKNDTLFINSLQTVSSGTPFFNVLLEFKATFDDGDTIFRFRQDASLNNWQLYLPKEVKSLKTDPRFWLLADISESHFQKSPDSVFLISPNPSNDHVKIQITDSSLTNFSLLLVGSNGQIIWQRKGSSPIEEFSVKGLPPGLYFVVLKKEKSVFQQKLIIK